MQVLPSQVDPSSPEFVANRAYQEGLLARLDEALRVAREERSAKSLARHREQGKLTVTERLDRLLDPDTPVLEIGALAARGRNDGANHSARSPTTAGMPRRSVGSRSGARMSTSVSPCSAASCATIADLPTPGGPQMNAGQRVFQSALRFLRICEGVMACRILVLVPG